MSTAKMKKLNLFAMRSQQEDLLRALMLLGCVEISDSDTMWDNPEFSAGRKCEATDLEEYREQHSILTRGIEIIDEYSPSKRMLFGEKPKFDADALLDDSQLDDYLQTASKLVSFDERIVQLTEEENRLKTIDKALVPDGSADNSSEVVASGNNTSDSIGVDEIAAEISALTAEIIREISKIDEFKLHADMLHTKIAMAQAAEKLVQTESVFFLSGWTSAADVFRLEELFSKYGCAWEFTTPSNSESKDLPMKSKNKPVAHSFASEYMYGLPSYSGVDVLPVAALIFSIFFGIVYGDMGYGLVLILWGLLGGIFLKSRSILKSASWLFSLCGITTVIFGFLSGRFLGNSVAVFSNIANLTSNMPWASINTPETLWAFINPIENPMRLLAPTLITGGVHVLLNMAISAYILIRNGHRMDALFNLVPWCLLFAGIAAGILGYTWWGLIPGVLALLFTRGLSKQSIADKLIGGLGYVLYDILALARDILTYSLFAALLVAGTAIANTAHTLGGFTGSIIVLVSVFIIGYPLNIGVNAVSVWLHKFRIWFFGFIDKFYKDVRALDPLSIKADYITIIQTEK